MSKDSMARRAGNQQRRMRLLALRTRSAGAGLWFSSGPASERPVVVGPGDPAIGRLIALCLRLSDAIERTAAGPILSCHGARQVDLGFELVSATAPGRGAQIAAVSAHLAPAVSA